jgi:arginyl-tRNA synthetase
VRLFGESIRARALGEEPPEGGYFGDYVGELAERIEGAAEADADELAQRGIELMLDGVRETLERFRVHMDRFFSESSLHDDGAFQKLIGLLEEREHVYPLEGAVWLRTTTFGDDKDRVLLRSNGEPTYFATDIAYHANKLERGYDQAIEVFGADHHGYVDRIRAAWQALGGDADALDVIIMQLVNLSEGGKRAQMSKRQGTLVTLDSLIDDIGVDAARYFLLQRNHDTTIDLDLELARRHTQDNPVYYLQYAHARIAGILAKAGDATPGTDRGEQPLHPSERALIKKLLEFPGEVEDAAERRAPHRIAAYLHETAQDFSAFYRDCKVVGDPNESFRLGLCVVTKRVLARGLALLGVSAPDEM